ncbi:exported hypothetical protein [Cupriavidus taiwanensis]|uniref:Uncharacterized protein n=1 Tax=Cupriavidus taiwanensis TaxID=164546 RepID=A0A375JBU4_9BURK|nr:exported hypothetical protein [Cupriavidus taiwanensis]
MGSEFMQPSVLASSATASIRLAASGGSCSKKARRLARAALTDPEHLLPDRIDYHRGKAMAFVQREFVHGQGTNAGMWQFSPPNSSKTKEKTPDVTSGAIRDALSGDTYNRLGCT